MARPVVANPFDNQIPTVAPTARTVDIYKRGVEKESPFAVLAQTLQRLEAKAVPALQREEQRQAAKEIAEGQELYNETRTSIGQAVKDGVIAEGESPYLRKGYRIANLNVLSARYANELQQALISNKLYKNGNPAAIDKFAADFHDSFKERGEFEGFAAEEVAEYFSTSAASATEQFRASWKSQHVAWQEAQNYKALGEEVSTFTATSFDGLTGDEEDQKVVVDALSTWITKKLADADRDGMDREKVNATIVDSILITAQEELDEDILDILDDVRVGANSEHLIGNTVEVRKKVLSARNYILGKQAQNEATKAAEEKADRIKFRDSAMVSAITAAANMRAAQKTSSTQDDDAARAEVDKAIKTLKDNGHASQAMTVINFFDAMEKAGDKQYAIDDVEFLKVQKAVLTEAEDISDAYNILLAGLRDQHVRAEDLSTIMNMWMRKHSSDGKPKKLAFLDSNTGVPRVFNNWLDTFAQKDMNGVYEENVASLVQQATIMFEDEFLQAEEAFIKENGREPTNKEYRELAKALTGDLSDVFVRPQETGESPQDYMAATQQLNEERREEEARLLAEQQEAAAEEARLAALSPEERAAEMAERELAEQLAAQQEAENNGGFLSRLFGSKNSAPKTDDIP